MGVINWGGVWGLKSCFSPPLAIGFKAQKMPFLPQFASFFFFVPVLHFSCKEREIAFSNQCWEYAAPKHWSNIKSLTSFKRGR